METFALIARIGEPKQAFIGWVIYFFVILVIAVIIAQIREWIRRAFQPPPPPPFHPPLIQVPPCDENTLFAVPVPDEKRNECLAQVNHLAASTPPGWQYRVVSALLDTQLTVLRSQFDRLLTTEQQKHSPRRLDWQQRNDYHSARDQELRETITKLSRTFTQDLTNACESCDLPAISKAVNKIVRRCEWIYQWGLDHYRFDDYTTSDGQRGLGPRVAEHIFRQVELLSNGLHRVLADSRFAGPVLFRSEFYIPQKEEVDRPVLGVVGAPKQD